MVDWASKGAQGAEFELVVERGKVREFARAVRAGHAAYTGAEPLAPPTFLTTMFHWEVEVDGGNPWDLVDMSEERGMHAEQEYRFHGPPPTAGERLVARSRIDDIWDKQSRGGGTLTFVRMITEFRSADSGELRAEAILTGVERAQAP
jgi:hypothetical protein